MTTARNAEPSCKAFGADLNLQLSSALIPEAGLGATPVRRTRKELKMRSWGDFYSKAATFTALLIVAADLAALVYNFSHERPVLSIAALVLAGFIWFTGWVCRRVSSFV